VFNQLTPAEVVRAIGVTARNAARSGDPASEFDRDQLMSAYSATRHLAVELASYGPVWREFTGALASQLRSASVEPDGELARVCGAPGDVPDVAAVGTAVCELLARLDADGSAAAHALRTRLRRLLRELADREVDLLAEALG
jgi:hypothetical protein